MLIRDEEMTQCHSPRKYFMEIKVFDREENGNERRHKVVLQLSRGRKLQSQTQTQLSSARKKSKENSGKYSRKRNSIELPPLYGRVS